MSNQNWYNQNKKKYTPQVLEVEALPNLEELRTQQKAIDKKYKPEEVEKKQIGFVKSYGNNQLYKGTDILSGKIKRLPETIKEKFLLINAIKRVFNEFALEIKTKEVCLKTDYDKGFLYEEVLKKSDLLYLKDKEYTEHCCWISVLSGNIDYLFPVEWIDWEKTLKILDIEVDKVHVQKI